MTQTVPSFFVPLPQRGTVRIAGPQRYDFLQRLVSNDLSLLTPQHPALYACLLTPQGKFLHDFFIVEKGETLWLDCEGGERTLDLEKRLKSYCLRTDVMISADPETPLHIVFPKDRAAAPPPTEYFSDPRAPEMGWRSWANPPEGLPEHPFSEWDHKRISLGIPDGSRDLIPGISTLAEGRIDRFHGVSYHKGCYVGQELTARMHHRSTGKKHLYPIRFHDAPPPVPGTEIHLNGEKIGEMRSSCADLGLALLRDETAQSLHTATGPFQIIEISP